MISNDDKNIIKELFSNMTLDQILAYNKYFTPTPAMGIIYLKVKSIDGARPTIWGSSVQEICNNVDRYQKVSAIL